MPEKKRASVNEKKMRRIDLECHFFTKEFVEVLYANKGYPRYEGEGNARRLWHAFTAYEPHGNILFNKLLDLGEGRLKEMDAMGVDVQVLSLSSPGCELFETSRGTALAKRCNDELSGVVGKYPDRFMGFASLAPQSPGEAADELERAVKDLGLVGWKTHSNYGSKYLDAQEYWPLLGKAEKLDVPIYLHPSAPSIPQLEGYGFALAGAPFGFGFDTALCMMRMILGGVFDKYPKLKIILGHLGEALPFLLKRIDFTFVRPHMADARPKIAKKPSEYLKNNMFVTTSGNYYQPAFMCTYQAIGVERIMLATDYPFEDMADALQFLEGLAISQKDKESIYYSNCKKLIPLR
jgi:predicted TIM-barrel fold metal-dependent hydrolase